MYYTYVLKSKKDSNYYIGYTESLKKRLSEHNSGKVRSTKYRIPFELVYYSPREMLSRSNPSANGLFHRVKPVDALRTLYIAKNIHPVESPISRRKSSILFNMVKNHLMVIDI